jgi:hypothetical protein
MDGKILIHITIESFNSPTGINHGKGFPQDKFWKLLAGFSRLDPGLDRNEGGRFEDGRFAV